MYKLELHCHSSEVSACAHCSGAQLIDVYRAAGYQGVVLTNHINRSTYQRMQDAPWPEKTEYFLRGYEIVRQAAGDDFDVLLGCEINLTPAAWPAYIPNDYLIYGVTADWLMKTGDMRDMTAEQLSAAAHEAGFLIVHAHPFRCGTVMMNPDLLYNGNIRHNSHNDLALAWAQMNGKIMTSGADFHETFDPPCGGIQTESRIRDNAALLRTLRSGDYQLIRA